MSQLNQESKQPSNTEELRTLDRAAMELSCVDLICQFEHMITAADESDRGDQVEDSAKLASNMLEKLIDFVDTYLTESNEEILEELGRASKAISVHKQALANRSWGTTLMSAFVSGAIDEVSNVTHVQLGKDLACAFATTLHHAIKLFGEKSEIGRRIGQSTIVFVKEFEAVW